MTAEITLGVKSLDHMTKQPPGNRYALLCGDLYNCKSQARMGHLGDYANYLKAKEDAMKHPHRASIQFYPDMDHLNPSVEFIDDFNKQK